jgi:hypothetical protein
LPPTLGGRGRWPAGRGEAARELGREGRRPTGEKGGGRQSAGEAASVVRNNSASSASGKEREVLATGEPVLRDGLMAGDGTLKDGKLGSTTTTISPAR